MVRNIFAGKSPRVVRVLLSTPSKTWRLRQLAAEANVSLGLASIVTNRLIDMGFLIRDRSLRLRLRKEEELLKRWGAVYDSSTWRHRAYYTQGTLYDIGRNLAETAKRYALKYAFTGSFATDLTTQYIRPAEIHMYVTSENELEKIVNEQNLEIAEIGGNIIFLIADDESVFYGAREITDNRVGTVTVVSEIQLILDLYNYTDRTREAAERLLAKEFERKTKEKNTFDMVREFFEQKGLIAKEVTNAGFRSQPDLLFFDPKTRQQIVVEFKNVTAKLDSVDQLKKTVLFLGEKTKGVLVAPSITNAAMKELEKANLQFEPMEAIERGLHKGTG